MIDTLTDLGEQFNIYVNSVITAVSDILDGLHTVTLPAEQTDIIGAFFPVAGVANLVSAYYGILALFFGITIVRFTISLIKR